MKYHEKQISQIHFLFLLTLPFHSVHSQDTTWLSGNKTASADVPQKPQNPFKKFIGEWTLKDDNWSHNWGNGTENIKIPNHHTPLVHRLSLTCWCAGCSTLTRSRRDCPSLNPSSACTSAVPANANVSRCHIDYRRSSYIRVHPKEYPLVTLTHSHPGNSTFLCRALARHFCHT